MCLNYVSGLPDPATISTPQLVVVFKNLLKRDSKTRDKALGELSTLLAEPDGVGYVDESVHWAWVQIYPKLAIDASRNVRALAHKVQGQVCRILGKQSSKYLKDSVGPWVAGLYDTDKSVSAAAESSLVEVFPSQEKRNSLYKLFEPQLLEFIHTVVAVETVDSLSDERYVPRDEAEGKYYRTLRSAVALFIHLLKTTSGEGDRYEDLAQSSKLWKLVYSPDGALARTVLDLVAVMVSSHPKYAESALPLISKNLITKGLEKASNAVLTDILQALIVLTRAFPQCWELASTDKRPALDYLLDFVRKGSRRSGRYFWPSVLALLSSLPDSISPYALKSPTGTSESVANAILEGIRKEMVVHLGAGWGTYLSVIEKIVASDVSTTSSQKILTSAFKNVEKHLLLQDSDTLDREILMIAGKKLADLWALDPTTLQHLLDELLVDIAFSRRNRSYFKRYLFTLKVMFDNLKDVSSGVTVLSLLARCLTRVFSSLEAIEEPSEDDNFKIHSASSILQAFDKDIFNYDKAIVQEIGQFLRTNLGAFIVSDSASDVIQILKLYTIHNQEDDATIQQSVELCFNSVVKLSDLDRRSSLFPLILKEYSLFRGRTTPIPLASEYLLSVYSSIDSWEITNDWDSILYGISSHGIFVSEDVASDILKGVAGLQMVQGKNVEKAIWTFSNLIKLDKPYFMRFIETDSGKELVSHLWKLAEDYPDAENILGAIEDSATVGNKDSASPETVVQNKTMDSLIDGLLSEIERSPIESVDISIQRGQRLLDQTQDRGAKLQLFERLLYYPSGEWHKKLRILCESGVASSLAVSNALGGGIFFLDPEHLMSDKKHNLRIIPDQLISMCIFTVCLIGTNKQAFETLPNDVQLTLIVSLALISEASSDHAFLTVTNDQKSSDNFMTEAIIAFSKDASAIVLDSLKGFSIGDAIESILSENKEGLTSLPHKIIQHLWDRSEKRDAEGYYSARVLAFILEYLANRPTITESIADELLTKVRTTKGFFSRNPLGVSAVLLGFNNFSLTVKTFDHLRNLFASNLIGKDSLPREFSSLVFLNILFGPSVEEFKSKTTETLPANRLIMCLNSLFQYTQSGQAYAPESAPLRIEVTKLVTKLLPLYEAVPSSIWTSAVELLGQNFVSLGPEWVAMEYFNLKYFNVLEALQEHIADLSEVWMERQSDLYAELLEVVFRARASINRARELANVQLLRAVSTTPLQLVDDPDSLYSLLAVPSFEVQRAGYILLHQIIPKQQEDRSIELQLMRSKLGDDDSEDCQKFSLPAELVSLLLEIPVRGAPAYDITRYLWSWMLIYDHLGKASYDLRKLYIAELEEGGHVDTFLTYISDRIVFGDLPSVLDGFKDVKELVKQYENGHLESIDGEINMLIVDLYYQALLYTGSMVKSWFMNIKKRQVTIALEKFTEQRISPTIIADELDSVESMLQKRDGLIDETMDAKVLRAINEVQAFYTVDDQTMEIAIRIPNLYPLKDITVEGIKRIGVKEKQWRAWLLASQAIATSQNGTVLDTLELFKRNVSFHFQGVTECAICYSILHQDHSLPTKTCTTCKNKFHANCLYKWFKSASASTCPLCRANFSFRIGSR